MSATYGTIWSSIAVSPSKFMVIFFYVYPRMRAYVEMRFDLIVYFSAPDFPGRFHGNQGDAVNTFIFYVFASGSGF